MHFFLVCVLSVDMKAAKANGILPVRPFSLPPLDAASLLRQTPFIMHSCGATHVVDAVEASGFPVRSAVLLWASGDAGTR